jgi:hypothetical protein
MVTPADRVPALPLVVQSTTEILQTATAHMRQLLDSFCYIGGLIARRLNVPQASILHLARSTVHGPRHAVILDHHVGGVSRTHSGERVAAALSLRSVHLLQAVAYERHRHRACLLVNPRDQCALPRSIACARGRRLLLCRRSRQEERVYGSALIHALSFLLVAPHLLAHSLACFLRVRRGPCFRL